MEQDEINRVYKNWQQLFPSKVLIDSLLWSIADSRHRRERLSDSQRRGRLYSDAPGICVNMISRDFVGK
jgi:hypothetical protein